MKRYIYIIILATAFAGCIKDNFDKVPNTSSDGSVNLLISRPEPVALDMGGTRAGANDFNEINDLNIIIAEGNGDDAVIIQSTYFNLGSIEDGAVIDGSGDQVITYHERGNDFGIHFSGDYLEYYGVPAETATFFIVANYGEGIDKTTIATVGALRNLKDDSHEVSGSVGLKHMMFGESEPAGNDAHAAHIGQVGHENGRTLKVELKRTAAMITVKIDGSGLANRIVITPLSISLHNVPAWAYLGKENVITTEPGGTTPIDDAVVGNGERYEAADLGWGMVASAVSGLSNTSTVVGAHYTDDPASGDAPNYSREDIMPLFLFENIHGDNFGAANTEAGQVSKRPAAAANISEAAINDVAGACSYLTVRARYQELNSDLSVKSGGVVEYRVFLGADVWQNFDVERNTYYRFTLVLDGTAIGEGNSSWRLEHDVNDESLLSESDFILNGAGEMIFINELITKLNSNMEIHHVGNTARQVNGSVYMHFVVGNAWRDFPLDAEQKYNGLGYDVVDPTNTSHSQFRLYVDPMGEEDGIGGNQGYMRKLTFHFETTSNHYTSKDITITQYAPTVTRLTEENTPEEIKIYINDVLHRSLPMTIYFDRVDRNAEQWGFDGESVANDPSGSGQANGIALINKSSAASYMPFGKPSAMMHAAFINYYQWVTSDFKANTAHTPAPTIDALRNYAQVDYNPQDPIVPNSIPSRAEWKLLDMLNQAGFEVFDTRHEPLPWINYWTSDAVEESSTQSWAYHIGGSTTEKVDRTTPVRYRMIYIDQE